VINKSLDLVAFLWVDRFALHCGAVTNFVDVFSIKEPCFETIAFKLDFFRALFALKPFEL